MNRKHTKTIALLALAGATTLPLTGVHAQTARVQLDGQPLNTQVSPIQRNNRTLLPMRDIFEALGATVEWDNASQSIKAKQGTNEIWLQIGNRAAQLNSTRVQLDQPAFLYQGVTMVPLRFVAEALGAQVTWNDALKLVSVTSAGGSTQPTNPVDPAPQPIVMTGVATRDVSSDQFEFRGENGQTYQVRRRTAGALPRIGERIEVRGNFDGNLFVADSVTLAAATSPTVSEIEFDATVTAIQSANRITVRRDNGVIYTVNVTAGVPANLNIGSRVRIAGNTSGNNVATIDRVVVVQDTTTPPRTVNYEAVVTEIQSATQVIVRRENGASVTVTSDANLPRNLTIGDRVLIDGEVTGRGLVTVERVTRVRGTTTTPPTNPPTTPGTGLVVRLRGTVESSQGRMLQVRGDDGRLYSVRANNSSFFARGEVVRINGRYENDIIIATSITRGRD